MNATDAPHHHHLHPWPAWRIGRQAAQGTVWTWGWNQYGMLGNGHGVTMFYTGTDYDSWVPFQVLGPGGVGHLNSIVAIAGGERHNAALDSNGQVWTWGWNAYGQLGNGITCSSDPYSTDCMGTTPAKIPNFTSVKVIASRGYHTLALKNDGTVWAWGLNDSGRLGDGTNRERSRCLGVPASKTGKNLLGLSKQSRRCMHVAHITFGWIN